MRRVLLVIAVLLGTSCNIERRSTGPASQVTQVLVWPDLVTLDPLASQQFEAYGRTTVGDSVPVDVDWSASAGIITSSGLFTADSSEDDVTITASLSDGTVSGSAVARKRKVVQVILEPAAVTLLPGGAQPFGARGVRDVGDTIGIAVNYTVTGGTINAGGIYTAGSVPGLYRVIARRQALADTAVVTIVLPSVASVTVSPASANLYVGRTIQLTATARDANGTILPGRAITWSTDAPGVASVSAAGVVTAAAVGSATITATSEGYGGGAIITVAVVPVASVVVTPASATIRLGTTTQLGAVTQDSAGNTLIGRAITWTSSAPGVASVSASGVVSAVAAGSATITATSEGKSGTASITATDVSVASVTVAPATATLRVGTTKQLGATMQDSAGNPLTGRTVTWSSSAPAVATVSTSGLVTAVAVGSATITATSEGKSGTATITVTLVPVASVTVTPATASLAIAATQQLSAVTKDSAGNTLTGRAVTWSSNAVGIATVSNAGLVTAVAVGSASITAASEGKSGSAAITVTAAPPPPPPPPPPRPGYYVAINGTSGGDGTSSQPWDLTTALRGAGGRVQPGDTIWVRGGTYRGAFTSTLTGTSAAPIVVRQYPGERATIDVNGSTSDALYVTGAYGIYWGFEIMNSSLDRTTVTPQRPHGVVNDGAHNKYVNLVVHDNGIGFYNYASAADLEIYGCLVYNNGWQATKGSGHALYIKSEAGPVYLRDNILFAQFAYGVHVYTNAGSGRLNNIHVEGNVSFNNGTISTAGSAALGANLLMGGQEPIQNGTLIGNMTYFSPGFGQYNVNLGFETTINDNLLVQGNYVVGGQRLFQVLYWRALTVSNNTLIGPARHVVLNDPNTGGQQWSGDIYHRDPAAMGWHYAGRDYSFSGWKAATGLGSTDQAIASLPTATRVFVRPNVYELGRATVVVYNWANQGAVSVDLSGVLVAGQAYEVRNAQNIFGAPVASGTFGGGTVSIPLGGVTPPAVIGGSPTAPLKTGPAFDVFIVTKVGG